MKVLFRFDASSRIGLGHAYRCIAVIEYLALHCDTSSVVITASLPGFLIEKLKMMGAKVELLKKELEELTVIEQLNVQYKSKVIILDGYQFTESYREKLFNTALKIITLDDTNSLSVLFCDVVINALPSARSLGYEKSATSAKHLLGLDYSIIREEFITAYKIPYSQRKKLLINFGGSDTANLTIPLIKLISDCSLSIASEDVVVVTGGAFLKVNTVAQLCQQFGFQHIHNSTDMAGLLTQCKMAICAPGSMVYELSYCGVPSLFLTVAENQLLSSLAHQALGWCRVEDGLQAASLDKVLLHLCELWGKANELENMSAIAMSLNDGLGIKRIVNKIEEIIA